MCSKKPSTQFPEGFLDFYNAYPKDRRKGRFEAVSEWRKLRLTAPQITQLMASLASWIASRDWRKDDGKYIPLPKNFLKTRRWEETVEPEPDELDWLRNNMPAPR